MDIAELCAQFTPDMPVELPVSNAYCLQRFVPCDRHSVAPVQDTRSQDRVISTKKLSA